MAYKGKYYPLNEEKYVGDPKNIIYRSLWERRCMKVFDTSDSFIKWSSEELAIPYYDPSTKKHRKYFPDFIVIMKARNGDKKVIMIEVKPLRQTKPPKEPKRRTKKYWNQILTYATNRAKWEAAQEFCESKGWEFKIMTEKDIL